MENLVYHNFNTGIRHFCDVDDADMDEIMKHCSFKSIKRNDYLLKQAQVESEIGFLNTGQIRHYYTTNDKEVTRWISLQNEFVTSLRSFILQIPSIENLQAITDCELVIIDRNAFNFLINENQGFKNFYIKALEYNYIAIEDRVFSLIEKSAEERFDWMSKNKPRFIREVPVMYAASMLGITTRHLSRLRKKFRI